MPRLSLRKDEQFEHGKEEARDHENCRSLYPLMGVTKPNNKLIQQDEIQTISKGVGNAVTDETMEHLALM